MEFPNQFWAEEEIERLRNESQDVEALRKLLIEERLAHAETTRKLAALRERLGLDRNNGLIWPETD